MNKRLLVIALILMVALNIVVITLVLTQKGHHPRHHGPHGGDPLVNALHLNDEQAHQFRSLKKAHMKESRARQEKIRDLREEMFAQMGQDSAKAEELAGNIGELVAEQEHSFIIHFSELRALCTPEQQTRFDEVMKDISRHPGPPRPMRPHGPPRH